MMPDDYKNEAEAMLKSIAQARSEHLTYEQMDAWVDDEMDQTAREWVVAHIWLCEFCAKQLTGYESYAQTMSGPIAAPAKLIPFGERVRAAFGWPQFAMAALAIVVVLLAPKVLKNARIGNPSAVESLQSLPPGLRQAARDVVTANAPLRPAALADFAPNVDPDIDYPASEVVEETQPELKWRQFGEKYEVTVVSGETTVARFTDLTATQRTVPIQLDRGATYVWEVRTPDQMHRGVFRVLGASEEQTLAQLRASGAGPLAMGAVAEQFGLLTLAETEFAMLKSQEGTKLLHNVDSLLGK
jgi:hypothetical protein